MTDRLADISFDDAMTSLAMRKQALDSGAVARTPAAVLDGTHFFQTVGQECVKQANMFNRAAQGIKDTWSSQSPMFNRAAQGIKDTWSSQSPEAKQNLVATGIGSAIGGAGALMSAPRGRRNWRTALEGAAIGGVTGGGLSLADQRLGLGAGKHVKDITSEAYNTVATPGGRGELIRRLTTSSVSPAAKARAETLDEVSNTNMQRDQALTVAGTHAGAAAVNLARPKTRGDVAAEALRREVLRPGVSQPDPLADLQAKHDVTMADLNAKAHAAKPQGTAAYDQARHAAEAEKLRFAQEKARIRASSNRDDFWTGVSQSDSLADLQAKHDVTMADLNAKAHAAKPQGAAAYDQARHAVEAEKLRFAQEQARIRASSNHSAAFAAESPVLNSAQLEELHDRIRPGQRNLPWEQKQKFMQMAANSKSKEFAAVRNAMQGGRASRFFKSLNPLGSGDDKSVRRILEALPEEEMANKILSKSVRRSPGLARGAVSQLPLLGLDWLSSKHSLSRAENMARSTYQHALASGDAGRIQEATRLMQYYDLDVPKGP